MGEALSGLSELGGFTSQAKETSSQIAIYITAAILALGLIFTVYSIATKDSKARTYTIAWIVAVIFSILFII